MADTRFFQNKGPFKTSQIAELTGSELSGNDDLLINDVAPLDKADTDQISFLDNIKYKDQFLATKAGACFVSPVTAEFAPEGCTLLISKHPYKAYAIMAGLFYPDTKPEGAVHPSAIIGQNVNTGENCTISAGVVIGDGVKIGDNCWIEAGAVIGDNVEIGDDCRIGANATVSHSLIGSHVRLYPGVRIGQDGFGFAIDPSGHVKVPQLGRVIVEDHVEIGANTCIDRGAGPDTVIGQGSWIDNLAQIGHNVRIGRGCIIVSQVGISGSTVLGDFVALGGQVGVAGHLNIGSGARIAAQSGIMRDVPPMEEQMGYPAMPIKSFMKQTALLKRMLKGDKK